MDRSADETELEPLRQKPPTGQQTTAGSDGTKTSKKSKIKSRTPSFSLRKSSKQRQTAADDNETRRADEQTTERLMAGGGHDGVTGDVGHRQQASLASLAHSHLSGELHGDFNQQEGGQSYLSKKKKGSTQQRASAMDIGGEPKTPSPTDRLSWIGFGLAVFALTCMCISVASPYWLQQWNLSFNTFENMGLWQICFHNYMHHRDDLQQQYNGCYWVFSRAEEMTKLRDWLLPPWFLSCQVMAIAILILEFTVVVVVALVFLHMCPMMNHEYHQIFSLFISGAIMFLCTMTTLILGILFGVQIQDRNWMPRPDWNFLSWGYGFLIISGIMSLAAGFMLFTSAWRAYNKLLKLQDDYFKQAMDMSQMYPTSQSQASYGIGYSDKPSYTSQPSYDKEPSYEAEKAAYRQPSYDEKQAYRQPSYDEKQAYRQPSYDDKEAYRQPSYDDKQAYRQPSYDDGQRGGYGDYGDDYDGNRSYDSARGGYDPPGYDQQYGQGQYGQGQYDQGYGQQGYSQYGRRA